MTKTKDRILQAAKQVLLNEGSSGFSMRKVASLADVRLNNVQYYFKTKVDLIDGLLAAYMDEYQSEILLCLDDVGTGKQGLKAFISNVILEESDPDEIKLSVAITSFAEQEEFKDKLDAFYKTFFDILVTFLAKSANKPCSDLQVQKAASLLLPFINGYGLVSNHITLDAVATEQMLTDILWDLINAK